MEELGKLIVDAVKDLGLSTVLILLCVVTTILAMWRFSKFLSPLITMVVSSHVTFVDGLGAKLTNQGEEITEIKESQGVILKKNEEHSLFLKDIADAHKQSAETLKSVAITQKGIMEILGAKTTKE